ncbi:hypothetical protein Tco_0425819 [Tanacetum coccineum]
MWRLLIEQYFQVQDYALWDGIKNRNSFKPAAQTRTNADGTSTTLIPGPVTAKEKAQKKNDGRKIDEIDQDSIISLVQHDVEIQGRYEHDMEFEIDFNAAQEVSTAEKDVSTTVPISTAGAIVTTDSVVVSTASPIRNTKVSTTDDINMAETLMYIRKSASKDKGKGKMDKFEPVQSKTKLQQEQERLGYKAAVRLQAKLEEEERQRIVRVHEAASSFNVEEWEDIQAKVEADEELVQRLQVGEREKYTEAKQARMLAELINQRKRVNTFVPIESEVDSAVPELAAGSLKRDVEEELDQESSKRQKTSESSELAKEPRDKEADELFTLKALGSTRISSELEIILRLFEPDADDELWKLQKHIHDLTWKLYDSCGVHHMPTEKEIDIYMLVEKEHPLLKDQEDDVFGRILSENKVQFKKLNDLEVRIESSAEKSLGDPKDASKQGRNEIDQDEGISWFQEDSKTQGRYCHDIGVNTTSTSITTASINITTAEPVTTASAPVTTASVSVSTAEPNYELATKLQEQEREELTIEEMSNWKFKRDAEEELDQESSKRQKTSESSELAEEPRVKEADELDDLVMLWSLVKEKFNSTESADGKEREIWVELKRLFEPHTDDELWKIQKHIHDLTWRLYDSCGVHHVSTEKGIDIYMLVEKEYPLSGGTLTLMLVAKLLVDQDNEMSKELLRKIFMQAERPRR